MRKAANLRWAARRRDRIGSGEEPEASPSAPSGARSGATPAQTRRRHCSAYQYKMNSVGNTNPINNNALARAAGRVSTLSASEFFQEEFGGHDEYKALCLRNPGKLLLVLKKLAGDLPGRELLYGRRPPGEGDPDG